MTYVYDGDTAVLVGRGHELRVRVVGINTPEVDGPYREAECFGEQASARGKELLLGKNVWVERDPGQGPTDKYGRDLRFIWINNEVDFGKQMLLGGYAYEYTYDLPYRYQAQYRQAQAQAQAAGRGLWARDTCAGQR